MRLSKSYMPNIQIKNLPIGVSTKCEDLHNEMNYAFSEFQKLNISFGPVLASMKPPPPPQILGIVSGHSVGWETNIHLMLC